MAEAKQPTPQVRWVADPSEPAGGYFVDAQGKRLPARDPSSGQLPAAPAANTTAALNELVTANWPGWKVIGTPVAATDTDGTALTDADGKPLQLVNLQSPAGQSRQITVRPGTAEGTFDLVKGPADVPEQRTPQETNENVAKAVADRQTAEAKAAEAQAALRKTQEDEREASYNQSQGNGYLTHAQLDTLRKTQQAQQLNEDQIAVQRGAMENTNRNTIVQNQIASQNAATAALTAASNARATEAQIKHAEGELDLDGAKFIYLQTQDEIKNQITERDQNLKDLQQQQTHEVQSQQNVLRGQELEQRRAEAGTTAATQAATAATSAAASVLGTERQAQTAAGGVGADVLSNRATAANNMLQNILGGAANMAQSSDNIGGGLQAPLPSGFGAALVSGIQGVTANQFGGNETLEAAARMVRGAQPGAEMTPQGQAAIGVLRQAFERFGQLSGAPHPAVAATTAAQQTGNGQGMSAPLTAQTPPAPAVATPAKAPAIAAQSSVSPMQVAPAPHQRSINYNPYTPPPLPTQASGMTAPVTINIGG